MGITVGGGGGPGSDTSAIHNNTAGEINAVATKGSPVSADVILVEDSADSFNKKKITIGTLPGGAPSGSAGGDLGGTYPNPTVNDGADAAAIHGDTDGEINAVTSKASPVSADILLIEDSAASFAKKKITVGTLPGNGSQQNANLSMQPLDEGSPAGNARGAGAVDWQSARSADFKAATGDHATIGGGEGNRVEEDWSTIAGGLNNTIIGGSQRSHIGGGEGNLINGAGDYNIIAGGWSHQITGGGREQFVGGGFNNNITGLGNKQTIVGGHDNEIDSPTGSEANFIGGGDSNLITGACDASVIPGGEENEINAASKAVATGYRALVNRYGEKAHAAGYFAEKGDAQHGSTIARVQTTDATKTELLLDGSSERHTVAKGVLQHVRLRVIAQNAALTKLAIWTVDGLALYRPNGVGTTVLLGSATGVAPDAGRTVGTGSNWLLDHTADTTNGAVKVEGTAVGESEAINWVASIEYVQGITAGT